MSKRAELQEGERSQKQRRMRCVKCYIPYPQDIWGGYIKEKVNQGVGGITKHISCLMSSEVNGREQSYKTGAEWMLL